MEKVKLMNMCKIVNPNNDKVLVQERIKSWQGIAFPGGKIEEGESIVESTKREVFEETGLIINKMKICGIKDWYYYDEKVRYLIFLFVTNDYEGTLKEETDEGRVYWISQDELKKEDMANDFDKLLAVFDDNNLNEMIYIDTKTDDEKSRWDLQLF